MSNPDALTFRIVRGDLEMDKFVKAVVEEMGKLSPLAAARAVVSPGFWVRAAKSCADLVGDMVHFSIGDVLVGAWKAHRKLRPYADPAKYPPGRVTKVPLVTHHIKASRDPSIAIFLANAPQGKIPFKLELDIEVEVGELVIRDGRIMGVEGGKATATGTLECAGVTVASKAFKPYEWTEAIRFGEEGIAIGRYQSPERTAP